METVHSLHFWIWIAGIGSFLAILFILITIWFNKRLRFKNARIEILTSVLPYNRRGYGGLDVVFPDISKNKKLVPYLFKLKEDGLYAAVAEYYYRLFSSLNLEAFLANLEALSRQPERFQTIPNWDGVSNFLLEKNSIPFQQKLEHLVFTDLYKNDYQQVDPVHKLAALVRVHRILQEYYSYKVTRFETVEFYTRKRICEMASRYIKESIDQILKEDKEEENKLMLFVNLYENALPLQAEENCVAALHEALVEIGKLFNDAQMDEREKWLVSTPFIFGKFIKKAESFQTVVPD